MALLRTDVPVTPDAVGDAIPAAPTTPTPAAQVVLNEKPESGWRRQLYEIIFESETRAGQLFDRWLIVLILTSIGVVVADSVESLHTRYHAVFDVAEWTFTALFTVEYIARLVCLRRPVRYARSFFGIVDLLAVLPTYIGLLFPQARALMDVRILRLLRVFRIFKLTAYVTEYQALGHALTVSRRKIMVFLSVVLMIVLIIGTLMYVIEGPANGFTSIPVSIYWAITTMTTVGFGDITPHTDIGRLISSVMMLVGWGTLAVPTGIVTSELTLRRMSPGRGSRMCRECLADGHAPNAHYCMQCGSHLARSPEGSEP
jgi:voltage-gated potassium channel